MPLCYLYFLYFVDVYLFTILLENKNNKKEKTKEKRRLWFVIFIGPYNYIRFLYTITTTTIYARVVLSISMNLKILNPDKISKKNMRRKYVLKPLIGVPSSFYDRDFACFEKQKFGQIRFTKSDPAMISYYNIVAWIGPKKKWFAHLHKKITRKKKYWRLYIIYI